MINILHVSQVGMKMGGTEECIYLLCKHLDPGKFRNFVWSPYGGGETLEKLAGTIKSATVSSDTREVVKFLADNNIDIAVIHSGALNSFCILPTIMFCRQVEGLLTVEVMHRPLPSWGAPLGIDHVVAVSRYVASKQLPEYSGIVTTIPNGIDISVFSPSPEKRKEAREYFGIPESARVMGFIGHLAEWKRPQDIVEAAPIINKSISQAQFLIAGDGPLRPLMEKRIAELELQNIRLLGMISRTQRELFYSALDLFLFPTAEEAFALVVVEAMLMGLPVVSYDYGPIPELFPESKDRSFLVKFKETGDLARAVIRLLGDKVEYERLRQEGFKTARQYFDIRNTVRSYDKLFADLFNARAEIPDYQASAQMYRSMGNINLVKADTSGASREYDEATKLDKGLASEINKDMARYLIALRKPEKALALLGNMSDPEAEALRQIAKSHLGQKDI
jgi:glycosyltransferase involved in cell wall biosynthesis